MNKIETSKTWQPLDRERGTIFIEAFIFFLKDFNPCKLHLSDTALIAEALKSKRCWNPKDSHAFCTTWPNDGTQRSSLAHVVGG